MKYKLSRKVYFLFVLIILFAITKVMTITSVKKEVIEKNNPMNFFFDAEVIKVMDGDTIEIEFLSTRPKDMNKTEKVRLIGINTPELNLHKPKEKEYYAEEAYLFTKKETYGKNIKLQFDDKSNLRDKYGRILCYVWIDDFLFNKILLEQGYAYYYPPFQFNSERMKLFKDAENYAQTQQIGLWSKTK